MKHDYIYELILDDYTRYRGGSLHTPLWNESPDKAILVLKLKLANGDFLLLQDYEEYNFFVEAVVSVNGESRIPYMYVMGCKNNMVTSYRVSLDDFESNLGQISVKNYPKGQEYYNKPTVGWHKGVR